MALTNAIYKQLQVFAMIAHQGSIRAAARELGVSAPSVSTSLKQLEGAVGLPLFMRSTRSMELTDAGQRLLERSASPMAELKLAVESVQELAESPAGRLAITLPRYVYQWMIRDIITDFCQCYPEIEVEISINDADVDIIAEGLDAGFRLGHRVSEHMVARQLSGPLRDTFFASPDYLRRHGRPTRPEELQEHPFIYYRFNTSRQLALPALMIEGRRVTYDLPRGIIVNDTDVLMDRACAGQGISRMLEPVSAPYFEDGRLEPLLEPYWSQLPGLYLYFPQRSQLARRVRVFIDFMTRNCPLGVPV